MAPVPEDNQNKQPNSNDDDSEQFYNPQFTLAINEPDSSDSEVSESDIGSTNGYSLLSQDPDEDNGQSSDDETIRDVNNVQSGFSVTTTRTSGQAMPGDIFMTEATGLSEEGWEPTAVVSGSCHTEFLAKFPDGKVPSYMQMPDTPKDKLSSQLWNQQRAESSTLHLDPAQESSILKAMARVSLPPENIPAWASNLSEEQWGQQVLARIGQPAAKAKTSSFSKTKTESSNLVTDKAESQTQNGTDGTWVAQFTDG